MDHHKLSVLYQDYNLSLNRGDNWSTLRFTCSLINLAVTCIGNSTNTTISIPSIWTSYHSTSRLTVLNKFWNYVSKHRIIFSFEHWLEYLYFGRNFSSEFVMDFNLHALVKTRSALFLSIEYTYNWSFLVVKIFA